MSKLRKKLQQARHEYQHQRYPGDLANDLLGDGPIHVPGAQLRRGARWVGPLSLAAALALVATVGWVLLKQPSAQEKEVAIVTPTQQNDTGNPSNTSVESSPIGSSTTQNDSGAAQSDSNATQTADEAAAEERLSLVPSGIASSQETSFSLVPSMTYDSAEEDSTTDDAVSH